MLILSELLSISDVDFINKARDNFLAVDQSAQGEITYRDLAHALHQVDSSIADDQILKVFEKLDCDGNGSISYSEWLCALVFSDHMTQKNISNLYKFLDVKKKGAITMKDLERAYRPHLFRLKLAYGKEEHALQTLLEELNFYTTQDAPP